MTPLVSKTMLFWVKPSHVMCWELMWVECLLHDTTTNAIESIKSGAEPAGVGRVVGIAVGSFVGGLGLRAATTRGFGGGFGGGL